MKNRIFTFWEPRENIPAYLNLCLKTWKKFLPDYEIVILDYKSLNDYIGENYFDPYLFKNFSLPMQADAVRAAVLNRHGGIWMDIDTIITSDKVKEILNCESDFVMIGTHLAFIAAKKNAKIVNLWDKECKKRIALHKKSKTFMFRFLHPRIFKRLKNWDYLGNSILKKYLKTKNKKEFFSFDKNFLGAFPEVLNVQNPSSAPKNYRQFYFEKDFSHFALENAKSIILLHNSWTPDAYKKMPEDEFLLQDSTISNIFKSILQNEVINET